MRRATCLGNCITEEIGLASFHRGKPGSSSGIYGRRKALFIPMRCGLYLQLHYRGVASAA